MQQTYFSVHGNGTSQISPPTGFAKTRIANDAWGGPRTAQEFLSSQSESDLQSQLNQSTAWVRDEPDDVTGASRKDVEPRSIKIRMVEEVKNLCPELHIELLAAWLEDLGQRSIDIVKAGSSQGVSSQVAKGPGRRPRKGTGVIPEAGRSQRCSRGYTRATF